MMDHDAEEKVGVVGDGVCQKTDTQGGPPLSYVAEKLRDALRTTHGLANLMDRSTVTSPDRKEVLLIMAHHAFHSQLVAYLALKNMLALLDSDDLLRRLRGYSPEEFDWWLARVDEHGSAAG